MKRKILLILFLFSCIISEAQIDAQGRSFADRQPTEIERCLLHLEYTVDGYIQKTDAYREDRKAEFIMMVLEIDSAGIVKDIHLLSDRKNIDSTYAILDRMKPSDFSGKVFKLWRNKTVSLPIYSIAGKNYVEPAIVAIPTSIESKRTGVMVRPLYYLTPGKSIACPMPGSFVIIDTLKKN